MTEIEFDEVCIKCEIFIYGWCAGKKFGTFERSEDCSSFVRYIFDSELDDLP